MHDQSKICRLCGSLRVFKSIFWIMFVCFHQLHMTLDLSAAAEVSSLKNQIFRINIDDLLNFLFYYHHICCCV